MLLIPSDYDGSRLKSAGSVSFLLHPAERRCAPTAVCFGLGSTVSACFLHQCFTPISTKGSDIDVQNIVAPDIYDVTVLLF